MEACNCCRTRSGRCPHTACCKDGLSVAASVSAAPIKESLLGTSPAAAEAEPCSGGEPSSDSGGEVSPACGSLAAASSEEASSGGGGGAACGCWTCCKSASIDSIAAC